MKIGDEVFYSGPVASHYVEGVILEIANGGLGGKSWIKLDDGNWYAKHNFKKRYAASAE